MPPPTPPTKLRGPGPSPTRHPLSQGALAQAYGGNTVGAGSPKCAILPQPLFRLQCSLSEACCLHPTGISKATCVHNLTSIPPHLRAGPPRVSPSEVRTRAAPPSARQTPDRSTRTGSRPCLHCHYRTDSRAWFRKSPKRRAQPVCSLVSCSPVHTPTFLHTLLQAGSPVRPSFNFALFPKCPLLSNKLLLVLQGPADMAHSL